MSSLTNIDRAWSARVNRVFDTQPRDGADPDAVWLPRAEEEQFADLLFQDGVHICVDGPSGTGKSSLVKTRLHREKKKVISIQLTNSAKWTDLCREIIGDLSKANSNVPLEAAIGFDALPKLKVGYKRKSKEKTANLSQWKAIGSQVNEWDLCRAIESSDSVLLIDDFEKANPELVVKMADVCKLMTQSFKGKIVLIGTNDVYHRIMAVEPALENRLFEMSVGALADMDAGWNLLCMGFDRLGISHPGQVYNPRSMSGEAFGKWQECKIAIYDAVATLPKALNEFGRTVCLGKSQKNPNLTIGNLVDAAREMVHEKVRGYMKKFPETVFMHKPEVRAVICAIFDRTMGSILHREEIFKEATASAGLSRDQFDLALGQLVEAELVTQTGRHGETVFISKPHMAHILGVCVKKFEQYSLDPKLFGPLGQLSLPLKV